jgi:predicted ribosomally synthesized peptide with SipW-like signal peptide
MIKRIVLSVVMITIAVSAVAAATSAYFSDGKVLSGNTFTTGTVKIGDTYGTPLHVTGLTPGVTVDVSDVDVDYTGTINADLYIGARGTSQPGDPTYLADKLWINIYKHGTTDLVWGGWVKDLSTNWKSIATDIGSGWQNYDLQFTLDGSAGNTYQGINNIDTVILIYAVQHGGVVPGTPYLTTGTNWF